MIKVLRFSTLLVLVLWLFTGCTQTNRDYYWASADVGVYGDHLHDDLGAYGEAHSRRGEYMTETGALAPDPGETYEHFQSRVLNTLTMQEYDIDMLQDSLTQKMKQIDYLQEQLGQLHKENTSLRSQAQSQAPRIAKAKQAAEQPFERYKVHKNDTLQKISKQTYGTHTGWLAIYRFNLERLPHGPNHISEGQTLLIPQFDSIQGLFGQG